MSAFDPRYARWLAWLVPFALLGLAIGIETDWGRELRRAPPPDVPIVPAPVATAILPEYRIDGGVGAMAATVDRPLFNATRRPAPAGVVAGAKPTIQRGQFTLTGTLITDGSAVAFLREATAGKARSVRKGDSINGMTVSEIQPDRVRLVLGDESEEIELKVAKGPKTTVQPSAAPAAVAATGAAGVRPAADSAAPPTDVAVGGRTARAARTQGGTAEENARASRRAARAAERAQGAQGAQGDNRTSGDVGLTGGPQGAPTINRNTQRRQR